MKASIVAIMLAAMGCSVEKLPPIRMVHRGLDMKPKRVVVLPTECVAAQMVRLDVDPTAWCRGIDQLVASELAFRGIEVIDLATLPARERTREQVDVVSINGTQASERRRVTVVGPTYSDVDMWTQRRAIAELGVDALVRVRATHIDMWPARTIALVRITRPEDAALIDASMCQLEVSRIASDVETFETAVRCALEGLGR